MQCLSWTDVSSKENETARLQDPEKCGRQDGAVMRRFCTIPGISARLGAAINVSVNRSDYRWPLPLPSPRGLRAQGFASGCRHVEKHLACLDRPLLGQRYLPQSMTRSRQHRRAGGRRFGKPRPLQAKPVRSTALVLLSPPSPAEKP